MQELENLKSQNETLQQLEEVEFETITSDFLSAKRGRTVKLLDSEVDPIKFNKRDGRTFDFEEPVFVRTISFISASDSAPQLEVQVEFVNGLKKSFTSLATSQHGKNRNFISINHVVTSFTIKSDRLIMDEKLKRVLVSGLTSKTFDELLTKFSDFLDNYKTYKKNADEVISATEKSLNDFKQSKESIEDEISELTKSIAEVQTSYSQEAENLEELKVLVAGTVKEKEAVEQAIKSMSEKETTLRNNVEELSQTSSKLNRTISDMKDEVNVLSSKKDLYAENMSGYLSEGSSQLWAYYILTGLAILGLGVMGIDAISKINELISEYKILLLAKSNVKAWDLIWLRVPYASIVLSVIGALSAFVKTLLDKIFEIHAQKRQIIGLSVLARDINTSSKHGLNINDENIYKFREQLKFELLSASMVGDAFKAVQSRRSKNETLPLMAKPIETIDAESEVVQ